MEALAAALVGLALGTVLGLLGGGGGIIAIPLLVHVLGQSIDQASTTSLLVVAAGAIAGLVPHAAAGRVQWREGAVFGLLGVLGAAVGARAALAADDRIQATGLILLMLLAAVAMLRGGQPAPVPARPGVVRLLIAATVVGLITGFFGVGGGFVAVPALILGAGLEPRRAAATGLLVIIINSAAAFAVRGPGLVDTATFPALFITASLAAAAAAVLSRHVPAPVLQRAFAVLLVGIAGYEAWQLATATAELPV